MSEGSSAPIVQNRPIDDAFHQQRLKTWQPILSPMNVIIIFLVVGVAFIPSGIGLMSMSNNLYEKIYQYDGDGAVSTSACIENSSCNVEFKLEEDIAGPLYVYYQLENFYQNHRMYVKSQSTSQLLDTFDITNTAEVKTLDDNDCKGMSRSVTGDKILWPCGLIANSFFNDVFQLNSASTTAGLTMNEKGIAWESDYDKFKNPENMKYVKIDSRAIQSCSGYNLPNDCKIYPTSGTQLYKYWYPNFDKVQYIFEKYPEINPILGMNDEHFMVWMRTAALPKFRKIYGIIKGPFNKGDTLYFNIANNFEVKSFGGTKSLVISSLSSMGGKNAYIGTAFLVVGSLSILLTILFIVKHLTSDRRKLGDTNLLRWDD